MELMEGAEPFRTIKDKKIGILLIHGLTSSPQGVRGLAERLVKAGFSVSAPLLAGHGTKPEDLMDKHPIDYIKSVERDYEVFKKKVKKVFVAGVSFGGNLALNLAMHHKVEGVVTMGTPIGMKRPWLLPLIALHWVFNPYLRKRLPKDIEEDEIIKNRVTYNKVAIPAIFRSFRWISKSRKKLRFVKAPVLVMHASHDFLVKEKSAKYIYDKVGTEDKKLLFVDNVYHGITIGPSQKRVCDEIIKFVRAHANVEK